MKPFVLIAAVLLATASGCARVIINQPISQRGDGWDVTLRLLTDGPSGYNEGNTHYTPERGERFIWAHITLHNAAPVARKFNFDRCDLDDGQQAVVPALIDADAFVDWLVNREPELAPNETITRKLIYSYPRDRSPTRFFCAPMVMTGLPQF
jgi:hypothetical protein